MKLPVHLDGSVIRDADNYLVACGMLQPDAAEIVRLLNAGARLAEAGKALSLAYPIITSWQDEWDAFRTALRDYAAVEGEQETQT